MVRELIASTLGAPVVNADIGTIDVHVFDQTAEEVYSALDIGTIYDTLQPWPVNEVGYNFQYTLPSDAFERVNGTVYRVEFIFNTSSTTTGPLYALWDLSIDPILTGVV